MRGICIFEDFGYKGLIPLVYMRPVYELRCGISLLMDKIINLYKNSRISLFCRDYLKEILEEKTGYPVNTSNFDQGALFINGRILMSKIIPVNGDQEIGVKDSTVVYARLDRENAKNLNPDLCLKSNLLNRLKRTNVKVVKCNHTLIKYPWNLINLNKSQIERDFSILADPGKINGRIYNGVYLLNKSQIYIGKGSVIKPGTVLDAENGPVYIGEDVEILSNATIEGPCFIGNSSKIKIGAKIYEGTSIGEVCKVGGEVEGAIIHSYSNKQHDGFLGHSYICKWCNLGADTNTSDLKNNYGNVKVYIDGELVDTGSAFVGLIMGDHSKSGINAMFNTGTVVGIMANIFGTSFPPKFIPSFSWGGAGSMVTYKLEKAIEVARIVMKRRNIELTKSKEKLLRKIFEITGDDRSKNGIFK